MNATKGDLLVNMINRLSLPEAANEDAPPPAPAPSAQVRPSRPGPGVRAPRLPEADEPARPLSPAEILARAARPGTGRRPRRLTPAAVIAQALDRPSPLDSFWGVWIAHQEVLRNRSLRLSGGNRADAEDALSNAMLRAAQAYARQPVQNPRAWLLRILHNACMDQHRRNATLAAMEDPPSEAPQTPLAGWEGVAPSPEEELSQAQMERAWREALSALPEPLSDPLRLYLEGWPDELIALQLNISRELVRKRRQLAKDRLRAALRF